MARTTLCLLTSVAAIGFSGVATAQINTVTEPVQSYQTLASLPVTYTETGVIKAQHIRPGDISPEEYQALLDEADRIRAFQGQSQSYSRSVTVPATSTSITTSQMAQPQSVTHSGKNYSPGSYEIELFEAVPASGGVQHVVAKGDTLYNISRRFGVSVTTLKTHNALTNNAISLGQVLRIPSAHGTTTVVENVATRTRPTLVRNVEPIPVNTYTGNVYAVLPGDTLYSISRRTCTTVSDLATTNGLGDVRAIQPGQRLTMPSGHCLN